MSFAMAFDVGMKAVGAFGANKAANAQAEQAYYQMELAEAARRDAQANAAFQGQMGAYQMRLQQEQDDYYKDIYRDQNAAEKEVQDYLRSQDSRNESRLLDDRDTVAARQAMMDRASAEARQFELERIARDDSLAQEERDYAIAELQRERGRARDERRLELDRMADAQITLDREYADRVSRLEEDKRIREQERLEEIDRQNVVISQAAETRDRLRNVLDQYGTLTAPELVGEDEFRRRSDVLYDTYKGEIDGLADRSMSMLEADLIRSGMDSGGSSNAQRAEIIARLAPEYQKARARAEGDAASGVDTANKIRQDRFENLQAALNAQMGAEVMAGTTALDLQAALNPTTSSVIDRDLGSSYASSLLNPTTSTVGVAAPMSIDSALRSVGQLSNSYAQQLTNPGYSYGATDYAGYASGPKLNNYDASTYFNNASNTLNNNYSTASTSATAAQKAAADGAQKAGAAMADGIGALGGVLDNNFTGASDWLGGIFGSKPATKE